MAENLTTPGFTVKPLTAETWPLFADLVTRHKGMFSSCWCTWFHRPCEGLGETPEGNRDIKQRLVEEGRAHAALVMDGDEAVAWAEYGTPAELPNLHHSKQYLAETTELPDYRVTCIFVDKASRKHGLAEVALRGALDLIAAAGGGRVEGYPHDHPPGKKVSASFLYNGTRRMYERVGFSYVRPKGQVNCVMTLDVPAVAAPLAT